MRAETCTAMAAGKGPSQRRATSLNRTAASFDALICDGPLPKAMAAHACALMARDPQGLLEVSETFEATGVLLLAAEAAATAAALRAGRGQRAGLVWERAHRLRAACEGAWSSALEVLPARLINLSPRETAAARLAREGRPNRKIAEALGISVRTVDSHLASVYRKLGIGGREDLVNVLGDAD